jgi:pimeloyl-ACP methyl ester carboxylesterase
MKNLGSPSTIAAVIICLAAVANQMSRMTPLIQSDADVMAHCNRGGFFNWRGHAIWYRASIVPDKPTLLLLHGFPTSSLDWHLIYPSLEQKFSVIMFDMLGFGLSDKPFDHVYSMVEQADIAEDLLVSLGVTTYHILAHDYGDSVAQELLARRRDRQGGAASSVSTATSYPISAVLLNGGIIPGSHRPLLTQHLLSNKYVGPVLKYATNRFLFGNSLNKVFGPATQLSNEAMDQHWLLFAHKAGWQVVDKLLGYMRERQARKVRWVDALFETDVPVCVVNGPLDPISGAHLLAAYHEEKARRADSRGSGGGGGEGSGWDAAVARARRLDCPMTTISGVGHYPQLEAPQGVMGESCSRPDDDVRSYSKTLLLQAVQGRSKNFTRRY